jgi:hypothetical protein
MASRELHNAVMLMVEFSKMYYTWFEAVFSVWSAPSLQNENPSSADTVQLWDIRQTVTM